MYCFLIKQFYLYDIFIWTLLWFFVKEVNIILNEQFQTLK